MGGRTIAQAKAVLTWTEVLQWEAYRAKHGPLHLQQRMVDAAALVAHSVSSTVMRKPGSAAPSFEDFLLYRQHVDVLEQPIDLETAMATWK